MLVKFATFTELKWKQIAHSIILGVSGILTCEGELAEVSVNRATMGF